MSDIPWQAWAALVAALLGGGGVASWWALAYDRADKRRAREDNAPITAADQLKAMLVSVTEATATATDARDRAMAAEETADIAAREARSATLRAEQAERDVLGLAQYIRTMWVGITHGTVPPHPPIPHLIRHILTDDDFPPPPAP